MFLGAHVSIAENIALAPERGKSVGADAIQIFSRSPRMLRRTKPIPPEDATAFREAMPANGIARAIIHANYLINLAGPDDNTLTYSRVAFVEELDRAQLLGVRDVIFHPGSHMGRGEAYAIRMIAASLDWCFEHANAPDVFAVLENTAGARTLVGDRFEQLAEMMKGSAHPGRPGVCGDTFHPFPARDDFLPRGGYEGRLRAIDETVRADREGADQGGHGIAPCGNMTIRGDDVPGVEHPFVWNSGQQCAPGLNRLEPDSSADVDAVDPPGQRAADSAVAVIEEDIRARHDRRKLGVGGLKQTGCIENRYSSHRRSGGRDRP